MIFKWLEILLNMITKIRVKLNHEEYEVECQHESDARKLIDDLSDKFKDGDSRINKKLSK